MASIGNLYASLTLNSAEFVSGLKRAERQTNQTTSTMKGHFNSLRLGAASAIGGIIAVFSVDFTSQLIKGALDYADAIVDLSERTGASTKTIQEFRYAAQLAGSDVETADVAIEKFTKNLGLAQGGSQGQIKMFRELGVTSANFEDALRQTIDGISKLPTLAQRNAAAMELFGKKAGTLTNLLSQGTKGFDELARKAQELGVVLSDDVVRGAGAANDKLDTMKMIVTSQFASVIVQNANAFVSMAEGLAKLVGALAQFWNQNPRAAMAIMGALAGGVVGGLPGAAVGGIAGYMGGDYIDRKRREANPGVYKAQDNLTAAQRRLDDAKKNRRTVASDPTGLGLFTVYKTTGPNPAAVKRAEGDVARAQAELVRQQGLSAARTKPPVPKPLDPLQGNLPPISSKPVKPSKPEKPKGPTAEELAKIAADNLFNFNRDLSDASRDLLDAQASLLANDPAAQARMERERLAEETRQENASIDRDMKPDPTRPNEPARLTAAQGEKLKLLNSQIETAKAELLAQQENQRLLEDGLKVRTSEIQNEQDLLSGSSALARTAKERRAIELKILDLQFQREKAELDAILASKTATDVEKQIARARLGILDQLKGQQSKQIEQQTMGPLAQYLDTIPKTAEEIDEAFQNIAVNGLQEFKEGILDAILESKNLGDVFGNVAKSIIRGLLDIALQQAIIKPIGEALFGGGSGEGGGGGGILGSIIGGAKKLLTKAVTPTQGRANGGLSQPGVYQFNERGDEAVNLPNGGTVLSTRAFRALARGGGGNTTIHVDARGSSDPAAVRLQVAQGIAAAMPINNQNATNATIGKLQRPRLGR